MDCLFCKIIKKEIPSEIVYEDNFVIVFLDINPVNPGHTLVVPKKHYPNFLSVKDDILKELITVVRKIAPAVIKAVESSSFNLVMNNGRVSGQLIDHLHFHLIPRFLGDGHQLWQGRAPQNNQEIGEKIRKNIL